MEKNQFKKNLLGRIDKCRIYMASIREIANELGITYAENPLYLSLESRKKVLNDLLEEIIEEGG